MATSQSPSFSHEDHMSHQDSSTVVMVEPITPAHTIDGSGCLDVKHLLQKMDICTCAAAEKHTRVNCVTASMGDVVFEYMPKCGELLELTASPVFAGRTSLDIGLNVVARSDGGVQRFVCYASFTYVTTRDKDGKKQMCPPLCVPENNENDDTSAMPESVQWERTVAYYRRALIKAEVKSSTMVKSDRGFGYGFDYEISEVVLPAHQNHMLHTFGGVVMSWMCKAALAEASRKAKRPCDQLRIRSVLRIEFVSGSDVAHHLIFRPRLNAVFDGGESAEIEVRVSRRSIKSGVEISMNTGYFYVSGITFGSRKDRPFSSYLEICPIAKEDVRGRVKSDALWRRRLLLARRRLLGGVGTAVEWHSALQDEAPILTILAVLRLVHHNDASVAWKTIRSEKDKDAIASIKQSISNRPKASDLHLEFIKGEALGRKDTFVLRCKGLIFNTTVTTLFDLIKNERPEWDERCSSISTIDAQSNDNSNEGLQWDIVQHIATTPTKAMLGGVLCCLLSGSLPRKNLPLCLLRAWKVDESGNGDAILASRSVQHPEAEKDSRTEVLPSGWFLSPLGNADGVCLTYVVEHDLVHLRGLAPTFSDERIIYLMAKTTRRWFTSFATIVGKE